MLPTLPAHPEVAGWTLCSAVEPIESGSRFAVPTFFVTTAEGASTSAEVGALGGGGFINDAAVADALWRSVLMPQTEDDFRMIWRRWHAMLHDPGYS